MLWRRFLRIAHLVIEKRRAWSSMNGMCFSGKNQHPIRGVIYFWHSFLFYGIALEGYVLAVYKPRPCFGKVYLGSTLHTSFQKDEKNRRTS